MRAAGLPGGRVRLPLIELSEWDREELEALMRRVGLLAAKTLDD